MTDQTVKTVSDAGEGAEGPKPGSVIKTSGPADLTKLIERVEKWQAAAVPAQETFPTDGKFFGDIYKVKDRSKVSIEEVVIFGYWDKNLLPTLHKYQQFCTQTGVKADQLSALTKLIERVEKWQAAHKDKVRVADLP